MEKKKKERKRGKKGKEKNAAPSTIHRPFVKNYTSPTYDFKSASFSPPLFSPPLFSRLFLFLPAFSIFPNHTDEGGRISSLSLSLLLNFSTSRVEKKSPDWKLISGLYRGCFDTPLVVIISYISPRRRSTRPFEKLPPAFYRAIPEIEVWDTRLANPLARVLGLENKRSIESLETVAPYYIFLPTILPMTLLGRGEGAVEERQKFLLAPIRPSTNLSFLFRFFFLFSFFIRIFRFEDSKRGCKRATRDSEQRYSTSQDRADQPDLEGGYRLPLATHHEGDTFTHLFPLLPSIHISISIFSTVWIDHRLQFSRNSCRCHRCALENFLNVIPFWKRTEK